MVKQHLKRMAVPKTWPVNRKHRTFIARPLPGGHTLREGMPLGAVLRELLGMTNSRREGNEILFKKSALIDGVRRKNIRSQVGLFDTLSFPDVNEHFRMSLTDKGKISMVSVKKDEASVKLCKINNKNKVKGKTQLNLGDGRNILTDKDEYKTGDSLLLEVPSQKIKQHLSFGKGSLIFLTGGKHIGQTGTVEDMKGNKIMYKTQQGAIAETLKRYAFVVGKGKPAITI